MVKNSESGASGMGAPLSVVWVIAGEVSPGGAGRYVIRMSAA